MKAPSNPTRTAKSLALGLLGLAAAAGLFAFSLAIGAGSDTRQDSGSQAAAGGPDEPKKIVADECISKTTPQETRDDLVTEVAARLDAGTNSNLGISREMAVDVLAFRPYFPETPPGWESETHLGHLGGGGPLAKCLVRTTVTDPSGGHTLTFPEQTEVDENGELSTIPASTYEVKREAKVITLPVIPGDALGNESSGPGYVNEMTTIGGHSAHLFIKESAQVVEFTWKVDGLLVGVSCSLLTEDECRAIAESVK